VTGAPLVVGYDGSPCSEAALEQAIELARALEATLLVAYAAGPPNRSVGEEHREYRQALAELGTAATDRGVSRAREAGVDAEARLVDAPPVDALLDLAEQVAARLVVVGTTGERPLAGMILGSVPYKLLHRARLPVLVVPLRDT